VGARRGFGTANLISIPAFSFGEGKRLQKKMFGAPNKDGRMPPEEGSKIPKSETFIAALTCRRKNLV